MNIYECAKLNNTCYGDPCELHTKSEISVTQDFCPYKNEHEKHEKIKWKLKQTKGTNVKKNN